MRKRLKEYLLFIKSVNITELSKNEKNELLKEMLVQIGFFQHERLVHLIVLSTIAIATLLSLLGYLIWPNTLLFLLSILLMILLLPYVIHYYFLENGVQKLYEYYDRVIK